MKFDDLVDDRLELRFKLRDELIYYTNFDDKRERLCILNALEKEIFELAHDRQHHEGYHRTYDRIASFIYLRHLSKHLRIYIDYCSKCELNQIKRHKPYESIILIDRPRISFHIVTMDFIVALWVTAEDYDVLFIVIDKFFKRNLIISGKTTYDATDWVDLPLIQQAWEIPLITISDRDFKFMFEFWQTLFTRLEVEILASTTYHSQTDEQSKRTNQTTEIALRYFITVNFEVDWTLVLLYLQNSLNNFKNQFTEVSLNEILYEFNVRDTLDLLSLFELLQKDFNRLRREQTEDIIAFANIMVKTYYDSSYKSLSVLKESSIFLRLHHKYKISGVINHKLHNQRVSSFKILEKVEKLIYRLKLSSLMLMYSIVSVAQLKSVQSALDSYDRRRIVVSEVEENEVITNIYKIEALLEKKISRDKSHYLIKWKNCGSEHNVWYSIDNLQGALELIEEYEARIRTLLRRSDRLGRDRRR